MKFLLDSLVYWGLLWLGSKQGPFEIESNFARTFDILILGESHLYRGFGIPLTQKEF